MLQHVQRSNTILSDLFTTIDGEGNFNGRKHLGNWCWYWLENCMFIAGICRKIMSAYYYSGELYEQEVACGVQNMAWHDWCPQRQWQCPNEMHDWASLHIFGFQDAWFCQATFIKVSFCNFCFMCQANKFLTSWQKTLAKAQEST